MDLARVSGAMMKTFYQLLGNALIANVVNFTVWFALTFWVYLETRSVFLTGSIAGFHLVLTAAFAVWFGSLVDHHRKTRVMQGSSLASLMLYAAALVLLWLAPQDRLNSPEDVLLWLLIALCMLGVIAGNLRTIALPTLVTLLVPADRRDRANGLVGMATGVGFLVTSAISGVLVARGGMSAALLVAIGLTLAVLAHVSLVRVEEPGREAARDQSAENGRIDLVGTIRVVLGVPGLMALIGLAAFNNFLGGVFMALMDAYGLSLMGVQAWGFFWAAVSCAFILSGVLIARTGLGKNPLRTLLLANLGAWSAASVFTLAPWIPLLAFGCVVWMLLGPYAEAAEQTTLQKVVPFERQGRVFGFAQAIEQAASPLTAFLIGPLTQFIVIPFMTTGEGARLVGGWFGTGADRGMALVFTLAGLLGVLITLLAFRSRAYRDLSMAYARPQDS